MTVQQKLILKTEVARLAKFTKDNVLMQQSINPFFGKSGASLFLCRFTEKFPNKEYENFSYELLQKWYSDVTGSFINNNKFELATTFLALDLMAKDDFVELEDDAHLFYLDFYSPNESLYNITRYTASIIYYTLRRLEFEKSEAEILKIKEKIIWIIDAIGEMYPASDDFYSFEDQLFINKKLDVTSATINYSTLVLKQILKVGFCTEYVKQILKNIIDKTQFYINEIVNSQKLILNPSNPILLSFLTNCCESLLNNNFEIDAAYKKAIINRLRCFCIQLRDIPWVYAEDSFAVRLRCCKSLYNINRKFNCKIIRNFVIGEMCRMLPSINDKAYNDFFRLENGTLNVGTLGSSGVGLFLISLLFEEQYENILTVV